MSVEVPNTLQHLFFIVVLNGGLVVIYGQTLVVIWGVYPGWVGQRCLEVKTQTLVICGSNSTLCGEGFEECGRGRWWLDECTWS